MSVKVYTDSFYRTTQATYGGGHARLNYPGRFIELGPFTQATFSVRGPKGGIIGSPQVYINKTNTPKRITRPNTSGNEIDVKALEVEQFTIGGMQFNLMNCIILILIILAIIYLYQKYKN